MPFKDLFSTQAEIYARYRPGYPDALFQYLASLTPTHICAWDCGTGNGQAALSLTNYFSYVIATDPSAQQLAHAVKHERIDYRIQSAESFDAPVKSIDIITIANALHWFEFEKFYDVVRRVLKRQGVIAAWAYGLPVVNDNVDMITNRYHNEIVDAFWVAENRLVENAYKDVPFPFEPVIAPGFISTLIFNLDDFIAYLKTWSATQKYIAKYDLDPTTLIYEELKEAWGDADKNKTVTWKLTLKIGRVNDL